MGSTCGLYKMYRSGGQDRIPISHIILWGGKMTLLGLGMQQATMQDHRPCEFKC